MKRACSLAAILFASAALLARADDDSSSTVTDAPLAPAFGQDSDSVPQIVTDTFEKQQQQLQRRPSTMTDLDKKELEREAQEKGWLWRNYQQAKQSHLNAASDGTSADKTLPATQGSLLLNPGNAKPVSPSSAISTPETANPYPSAYASTSTPSTNNNYYRPAITPLGTGFGFDGLHDLYSTLPTAKLAGSTPAPLASPALINNNPAKDNSAMETPGLTAAESDPLASADLKLDFAAPDSSDQKQSDQNNLLGPALPPATNADLLQKTTDASMTLPGLTKTPQPSVNETPVKIYENDPTPDRIPQPSPVREPIADPLDIPYH